jgi:hypothetical protein
MWLTGEDGFIETLVDRGRAGSLGKLETDGKLAVRSESEILMSSGMKI